MKKNIANILKVILSLGLGVFIAWWAFKDLSAEEKNQLQDTIHRANYFWLLLGPAIGILSNIVRALRWEMMLNSLGYKPKFSNVNSAVYIMYFGNLLFPRLGEVTRCSILYKTDNVPIEKSIGTMVVERVVDMLTLILVGVLLVVFEYELLFSLFDKYVIAPYAAKFSKLSNGSLIFFVILSGIALVLILYFLYQKLKETALVKKIEGLFLGVMDGLISIKDLPNPFLFIFYSLLIWFMYFLMIYISFRALPETENLGIFAGLACVFFGTFAFIITQGGIGLYQVIVKEVLLLYFVAAPVGFAFGLLVWSLQTLMVAICGLLAVLYLFLSKK